MQVLIIPTSLVKLTLFFVTHISKSIMSCLGGIILYSILVNVLSFFIFSLFVVINILLGQAWLEDSSMQSFFNFLGL